MPQDPILLGSAHSRFAVSRVEQMPLRTEDSPAVPDEKAPVCMPSAAPSSLPFVQLFTDGACRGNPGPGGWAYLLRYPATGAEKEASGGAPHTTNNQMELQAVISGLTALKRRSQVEVITDSTYVAKGCSEWLPGWKAKGWKRREGKALKPVKNVELWQELDGLLARHDVRFQIVKGHAGHAENERCDELAVAAAEQYR